MFKKKQTSSGGSSNALKRKAMVCSTNAAAISIGVHVLLIFLAGSIVAIRYVQKRDAAFAGENISRPKLERRQLQMPVKVKNLQKKSSRPKITTRMASVAQSSFSLPDTMGMGDLGAGGFDRSSAGERSLSSMGSAGNLGFGVSGVNFFGARSKGEKVVFIVDAGTPMLEDYRGGYFTYDFAKDRLAEMIAGLSSATLFNVMVYVKDEAVMFRPNLVPATPENRQAVKEWFAPVNSDPSVVGQLDALPGTYYPPRYYEDTKLGELFEWVRPVQAAMEQQADNIFVLCHGYGDVKVPPETIMRVFEIESKEEWLAAKGWGPEKLEANRIEHEKMRAIAAQRLEEENRKRAEQGVPPRIVGDWYYYMYQVLKLTPPEYPPRLHHLVDYFVHPPEWIIEHLEQVVEFNYTPQKLPAPSVHFVKLIASDGTPVDPPGDDFKTYFYLSLKKVAKEFNGRFEHLRGAESVEDLYRYNDLNN